ncbi:hypothetical protein LCGC14_1166950 [marine sediment metagenome]|uniref:Uncharacterized protein n=1 Tax=marine sediment metagenome TaxID=412755 RepID=A0A0F9LVV3_9ZZZZ
MLSAGMNEMKIKRINYFGKKTIKKFIIQLNFNRDFELLDILKIAEFAKSIEEEFNDVPKIILMPKIINKRWQFYHDLR